VIASHELPRSLSELNVVVVSGVVIDGFRDDGDDSSRRGGTSSGRGIGLCSASLVHPR